MSEVIYSYFTVLVPNHIVQTEYQKKIMSSVDRSEKDHLYQRLAVVRGENKDHKFGNGKICMRIVRPAKETVGTHTYQVSFSFCSFMDQFNKKRARGLADSKFLKGQFIIISTDHKLNAKQVAMSALNNFLYEVSSINMPVWLEATNLENIIPDIKRRYNKK